jgi:hypothetical protein
MSGRESSSLRVLLIFDSLHTVSIHLNAQIRLIWGLESGTPGSDVGIFFLQCYHHLIDVLGFHRHIR